MTSLKSFTQRLAKSQDGTIAIYFVFLLFGFCMIMGLTIDGGRAITTKTEMANALDSATLAATRLLMTGNPTDAEIVALATDYFDKNLSAQTEQVVNHGPLHVHIDRVTKTVSISVTAQVRTLFAAVLERNYIDILVESQATYSVNDIELGLVLDTTGSMKDPSKGGGGKSKIDELKIAAAKMFDILLPDNGAPSDTRVGIAPFSTSVNAGVFAGAVTNGKNTDNCIVERTGAEAWTDADPTLLGQYMRPGSKALKDIDPTEGAYGYECPADSVLPLTNDGTQWGWYLISPNWDSVWPAASIPKPYGTKNLVKSIVVMTDGIYNTAYSNGKTAAQQAVTLCNNAKAQGVIVYTVGFTSPKAAEATLTACASIDPDTGKPNYFHADSEAELSAAFADIAVKLGQLRVSR
jgi:Flp pilus assembly protein TadG